MTSVNIVDVALVMAVDVSSSIDKGDYALQMLGIAKALRQPDIFEAISSGPSKAIAISLVQWSTSEKQALSVPWQVLQAEADLVAAADTIENAPRDWRPGGTAMAAALTYCTGLFASLPVRANRLVIDVSGDGDESEGGNVPQARNAALARGITINGLPIVSGSPTIVAYYTDVVIGGSACFVEPAVNISDFGEAMHRKLLRELLSPVT